MVQPNQTGDPAYRTRNPEQLRADIDAGRTGDKVAYPDPAAAPLGSDDEASAAGNQQIGRDILAPASQQAEAQKGTPSGNPEARSRTWIYIAVAAAVVVIMLLLGTMLPYQAG